MKLLRSRCCGRGAGVCDGDNQRDVYLLWILLSGYVFKLKIRLSRWKASRLCRRPPRRYRLCYSCRVRNSWRRRQLPGEHRWLKMQDEVISVLNPYQTGRVQQNAARYQIMARRIRTHPRLLRCAWNLSYLTSTLFVLWWECKSKTDNFGWTEKPCKQAPEPLLTFLNYLTYGYMIDNVLLILAGILHGRDAQARPNSSIHNEQCPLCWSCCLF